MNDPVPNPRSAAARTQWLRGVTDLLVLSLVAEGRSYGYALVERLVDAGLDDLNEATVYGTLRRLEGAGLLTSSLAASSSGPARRYYEITTTGRRALRADTRAWNDFVKTVTAVLSSDGARTNRSAS